MPSLQESINTDISRYERVDIVKPPIMQSNASLEPVYNPYLRCPLPPVAVTPDSLRQFYLKDQVPQARVLSPSQNPAGSSGVTTVVQSGTITNAGSSGGSSLEGTPSAQSASITTQELNPAQSEQNQLLLSEAFSIIHVSVSAAARVRLYSAADFQSTDLARGQTPPLPGAQHGVILDLWLDTPDKFDWVMSPAAYGANQDSPQTTQTYITITNLSQQAQAISATLTYFNEEE